MNHSEIADKISKILELANSAYQCLTHSRVIRGDGGSWVTDINEVWTISQELVRSQRIWFDVVVGWREGDTIGKTHVEVQARNETDAGIFAMDKLKETRTSDEAWVEEVKEIGVT
jgi:hypothetical protein